MRRFSLIVAAGVLSLATMYGQGSGGGGTPGSGGGSGATSTCTTAPTSVNAFTLERVLNLNQTLSTITPTIPPSIVVGILGGGLEAREQFSFDPTKNQVKGLIFAAQPGSGSGQPIPPNTIPAANLLTNYTVNIDKMYFSCQPVPSVLMTGVVSQNDPISPFGNLVGTPIAISIGYTTDNPPKVNNVVVTAAGQAVLYSASAIGNLSFPSTPVTPPGSSGNNPVITLPPGQYTASTTVQGGFERTTTDRQISLGFSGTDPQNLPLTWNTTQPTPSATGGCQIFAGMLPNWQPGQSCTLTAGISGDPSNPLITLSQGPGDYLFLVTATNSQNGMTTQPIIIHYQGR